MIGLLDVILAEAPGFLLIANFLKIAERAVRQLPDASVGVTTRILSSSKLWEPEKNPHQWH